MANENITNMLEKYQKYESEKVTGSLSELISRKSEIHECNELKQVNNGLNTKLTKEIYKNDNIDWVYLIKDLNSGLWEMCISYWNNEYDKFQVASSPILICPYCGKKLL